MPCHKLETCTAARPLDASLALREGTFLEGLRAAGRHHRPSGWLVISTAPTLRRQAQGYVWSVQRTLYKLHSVGRSFIPVRAADHHVVESCLLPGYDLTETTRGEREHPFPVHSTGPRISRRLGCKFAIMDSRRDLSWAWEQRTTPTWQKTVEAWLSGPLFPFGQKEDARSKDEEPGEPEPGTTGWDAEHISPTQRDVTEAVNVGITQPRVPAVSVGQAFKNSHCMPQ